MNADLKKQITDLQQRRAAELLKAGDINDAAFKEGRDLTTEERASFDAAMQSADGLQADIRRLSALKEENGRLLDSAGEVVASQDAVPVHWAYPTTAWRPGETAIDSYDFALPPGVAPDALSPLVILYRATDGEEVGRFQPDS